MGLENFHPQEHLKQFAETQYQQDLEILKQEIDTIDASALAEELQRLKDEEQEVMEHNKPTAIDYHTLTGALNQIKNLKTLEDWDQALAHWAKDKVWELSDLQNAIDNRYNMNSSNSYKTIGTLLTVFTRGVGRLAEARFPQELDQQNQRHTDQEKLDEMKRHAQSMNVSG